MPANAAYTVEGILSHPKMFGLTTITDAQRAICRALDGRPIGKLWEQEPIRSMFGGQLPPVGAPPHEVAILAAIRCAKSMMAAAAAIRMALTVDTTGLGPGETPRVPVLATDKDTAAVVFNHLVGNIQASPILHPLLAKEPTADSVELWSPSKRRVEIKVTALSRAGSTLVGRWLAGCIFDEAPRMGGDEDTVLSLDQARHAVRGRLLKGAQILYPGSPWSPIGPLYDMSSKYFGRYVPGGVLVIRAPGWVLNPGYWTPERCEREKEADPTAYVMNVCAEFGDPEQALIPSQSLELCKRRFPVIEEPEERLQYVAAMDPATRGNAWTLIVLSCIGTHPGTYTPVYSVALAKQWRGSPKEPLSPDRVLSEISAICLQYGIASALTDQYSADALTDIASRNNLQLYSETMTGPKRVELFERLRLLVMERMLRLPNDPVLFRDLVSVKKRLTPNGYSIVLPSTGDGRHADYAAALALATSALPGLPHEKPKPVDRDLKEALDRLRPPTGDRAWDGIAERLSGLR